MLKFTNRNMNLILKETSNQLRQMFYSELETATIYSWGSEHFPLLKKTHFIININTL